ncbi:MAG: hypothetical protein Q8K74_06425 [Candidatus Nitrotoga sp.]|nr:hypothetical protein [Candidatus Nitrotoga sp.]MDP1855671.1 hypothetical protein [Candidatus Nitrotoga sp.]
MDKQEALMEWYILNGDRWVNWRMAELDYTKKELTVFLKESNLLDGETVNRDWSFKLNNSAMELLKSSAPTPLE